MHKHWQDCRVAADISASLNLQAMVARHTRLLLSLHSSEAMEFRIQLAAAAAGVGGAIQPDTIPGGRLGVLGQGQKSHAAHLNA
jgi:hypothetical protein